MTWPGIEPRSPGALANTLLIRPILINLGKIQSNQWKHSGSPLLKKFKQAASIGKVMTSIFFYSEGVIMIDYLEKGKTNGQYYVSELRQLKEAINLKCRLKLRTDVLLLQDNAPIHTAQVVITEVANCIFELLTHPSHSTNLAPSDFFLFPKLKCHQCGCHFRNNDNVIWAEGGIFGGPEL